MKQAHTNTKNDLSEANSRDFDTCSRLNRLPSSTKILGAELKSTLGDMTVLFPVKIEKK